MKKPTKAALAAARELLAPAIALAEVRAVLEQQGKVLQSVQVTLEYLLEVVRKSPDPKVYFLGDAHTTHVTKAQVRKERARAKKTKK